MAQPEEAAAKAESSFDSFLSDIAGVVAEQLRELEPRRTLRVTHFPTDADKVVWHWPDVLSQLIEDPR
jgi:hypothetical protein